MSKMVFWFKTARSLHSTVHIPYR